MRLSINAAKNPIIQHGQKKKTIRNILLFEPTVAKLYDGDFHHVAHLY